MNSPISTFDHTYPCDVVNFTPYNMMMKVVRYDNMSKVTHHSPICGAGSELTQLHRTGQQFRWSQALVWDRKLKRLSSFWKVGSTFRVTATHDLV